MRYAPFGRTGAEVSIVGFGAWAIGGTAYGSVEPSEALRALAAAEELGVNLIDTAAVYGESEAVIGRFLTGRRDRWFVASKYSGQPQGMTRLVEEQLRRLGTDRIDFYQIHWAPTSREQGLYDELARLKESGKVRFAGVSLAGAGDIDRVLREDVIDGFQVPFSLLEPRPLLERLDAIRASGIAVLVRSALASGFLTGKYGHDAVFEGGADRRSGWDADAIRRTVAAVERFRFLETPDRSMASAAVAYALSFAGVTSVLLGTKSATQAAQNFRLPEPLERDLTDRIARIQDDLGLTRDPFVDRLRGYASRALRRMLRR